MYVLVTCWLSGQGPSMAVYGPWPWGRCDAERRTRIEQHAAEVRAGRYFAAVIAPRTTTRNDAPRAAAYRRGSNASGQEA